MKSVPLNGENCIVCKGTVHTGSSRTLRVAASSQMKSSGECHVASVGEWRDNKAPGVADIFVPVVKRGLVLSNPTDVLLLYTVSYWQGSPCPKRSAAGKTSRRRWQIRRQHGRVGRSRPCYGPRTSPRLQERSQTSMVSRATMRRRTRALTGSSNSDVSRVRRAAHFLRSVLSMSVGSS